MIKLFENQVRDRSQISDRTIEKIERRKIPLSTIEYLSNKWLIRIWLATIDVIMKDIDGNPIGIRKRDLAVKTKYKSTAEEWSKMWFYFDEINFQQPIIICEGEPDWLSIVKPWSNILGLSSSTMLWRAINDIRKESATPIYLIVDNDTAAQIMIDKIAHESVFDCRSILGESKDVNDLICSWWQILIDHIEEFASPIVQRGKEVDPVTQNSFCIYQNGKPVSINEEFIASNIVQEYDIIGDNGNLFQYTSETWLRESINEFKLGRIVIDYIKIGLSELWKSKVTRNSKNEVIDFIRVYAESEETKKLFNPRHTMEIALNDKILDLNTRTARDFHKEDYRMKKFPYSYSDIMDPNLEEPKIWNKFLDEVFEGNEDVDNIKGFLQEYLWYLMIPSNKYEKSILLYWPGWNGKWTILNTFHAVLGAENCSTIWMHELCKDQNLHLLMWSMANFDFDMKSGVKIDDGSIKKILVSEPITAKEVFHRPINFSPSCKFIIGTNQLPSVDNIDSSITRRFCFIELPNCFEWVENFDLKEEIKNELTSIFKRWLVGLEKLLKRGCFEIPKSIANVVKEFVDEQDNVKEFLDTTESYETCEEDDEATCFIRVNDIYTDYCLFCKSISEKPEHRNIFSKRLKRLWYELKKVKWQRAVLGLREKM